MKNQKLKNRDVNNEFKSSIKKLNNTNFKEIKFIRVDSKKEDDSLSGYFSLFD
jgi:hypothetical protein